TGALKCFSLLTPSCSPCLGGHSAGSASEWSVNGTPVDFSTDGRRRLSGGNLIIGHPDRTWDAGTYQCIATNSVGTILSSRATLWFAYLEMFKSQTRSAVSVREGQGVVLLCGPPSHSGELTFTWVFNEYPNFIQQDSRRFVSQVTGNLYIAKVEPSDVGNYTCVVINSVTKGKVLSSSTPLVLRTDGAMGEYEPKIEVNFPETVPAAKGSAVMLECFALGNPVPEITWRRANGVPFPSKVKVQKSSAVLEIPDFQQEDAGGYECVAENTRGKNVARGLSVFTAKPQWIQTATDTALAIGEKLLWECKANGKPKPSYSWLRNGETLATEVENGALSIAAVNLSDAAMYQCVAENKHGVLYSSAELLVLGKPLRTLLKARAGTEVVLECRPQAYPQAVTLWKKVFSRILLLPGGTLKIINVTKADGGSYTCMARNQFGTASTTGRLLITEPTRITQGPTNMEIIVGESIVLPCQVTSDPALDVSFSWVFNGQLVDFQQDKTHFERIFAGDLMIRNIQLGHAGKYICIVDTDVESLSAAAVLMVKGPPGPPSAVTVEEITDSTAQLSWMSGRDNYSPIKGYVIQGRTAFTLGWQALDTVPEVIFGNTLTATVVGLNAWVEYEFRVVSSNAVGVGEPSPPSAKTRTEDAVPDTPPTDIGGGGGTQSELVITWEPVPEELQNGDGFGYIIAFRPVGGATWTRAIISTPEVARYVYRNDSIPPFFPFDVKVGAFNKRGEGPFSSITTVFSAEEGEPAGRGDRQCEEHAAVFTCIFTSRGEDVSRPPSPSTQSPGVVHDTKPDTVGKVRVFGNQSSVNISALTGNSQYFLTVSAFNTAGTGPASPSVNATTKKASQPPMNVEWTLIGAQLTLHWDPVVAMETESEVTGYQVSTRFRFLSYSRVRTTAELTLPANDDYLIQVRVLSEGGEGAATEPIRIHRLSMSARGSGTQRPDNSPPSLAVAFVLSTFCSSLW
uniref:Contactin 3b n=1 Tax=Paramormyrops kingsleyae TaxID=1676925 RepID=A0A3B3T7B9_9TELE